MTRLPNNAGRHGVAIAPPLVTAPPVSLQRPDRKAPESVFTSLLPGYEIRGGWFDRIRVPVGLTSTNGVARWFGLRRLRIPEDFAQEVTLFGSTITQLPPNVAGVDFDDLVGAETVPWGNRHGSDCAIVIGRNLPIIPNAWTSAPCFAAGLDADGSANSSADIPNPSEYFAVQYFPTGELVGSDDDTTILNKIVTTRQMSPYVARFTHGNTLDVALVMKGEYVEGLGEEKFLSGFADVRLMIGQVNAGQGFTE